MPSGRTAAAIAVLDGDAPLLARIEGATAVLTFNRPAVRNAINRDVVERMAALLETIDDDEDIRVIVLTGVGDKAFSAGADLREVEAGAPPSLGEVGLLRGFAGFTAYGLRKPTIAAVNGVAVGGGMEVVIACDLAVASENARFGLVEVRTGVFAAGGGAFRLPRQIPMKSAMELLLTGDLIDAERARELGLVNSVVPANRTVDVALELAARIAVHPPAGVEATRSIARGISGGRFQGEIGDWERTRSKVAELLTSSAAKSLQ